MTSPDTCTPLYQLPYPFGGSRPCDIDETSCAFAEAVENQLNALDAVVQRTETTLPMAWVRTMIPFTVVQNAAQSVVYPVPFDEAVVDTANMADLTVLGNGLTVTQGGLYLLWIYIRGNASVVGGATTGATYQVLADPPGNVSNIWIPHPSMINIALGENHRQTSASVVSAVAGTSFIFNIVPSGLANDAIAYLEADMGLIWFGDIP